MIDHTFDPLPKRAHRTGRPASGPRTWFSSNTGWSAQHFCDLSWRDVLMPVAVGLGGLGLSFVLPEGDGATVIRIIASGVLLFGLRRTLLRLIATLYHAN